VERYEELVKKQVERLEKMKQNNGKVEQIKTETELLKTR